MDLTSIHPNCRQNPAFARFCLQPEGTLMSLMLFSFLSLFQFKHSLFFRLFFLPAASYDSAMCAYDSNFGWDCVCDTKVSV